MSDVDTGKILRHQLKRLRCVLLLKAQLGPENGKKNMIITILKIPGLKKVPAGH